MPAAEVVALLSIFIGLPWVVFSGIAKVKAAGSRSSGKGGSGIRKSELEALIAVSVEEATAPLLRRVEVLEAILGDENEALDRIDPAVLTGVIDPSAEADDWADAPRRARA